MLQSIRTRWIAETITRPNRIKAEAAGAASVQPWGQADSDNKNHCAAAKALAQSLNWRGAFVGGCFNGDARAREWVNIGRKIPDGYFPPPPGSRFVEGADWFQID